MTDQPIPNTTSNPAQPVDNDSTSSDPAVEAVVADALKIQNTFAQNDSSAAHNVQTDQQNPSVLDPATSSQTEQAVQTSQVVAPAITPTTDQAVADPLPTEPHVSPPDLLAPNDEMAVSTNQTLSTMPVLDDQPFTQDVQSAVPSSDTVAVPDENAGKSPLDILEEILGKTEAGAAGDEPPKEPEKSPEEIEAERQKHEAEEIARLEQQRQQLLSEVQSPEQQERDAIRQEQKSLLKSGDVNDIYQIKREKVQVRE